MNIEKDDPQNWLTESQRILQSLWAFKKELSKSYNSNCDNVDIHICRIEKQISKMNRLSEEMMKMELTTLKHKVVLAKKILDQNG